MSSKVLIIGGDSIIGRALAVRLRAAGREVVGTTRNNVVETDHLRRLDLSLPTDEWQVPDACAHVIFCATAGNMDACRDQPEATRKINVMHTGALARRLALDGSSVLFLSTNMVYDGSLSLVPGTAPVSPCSEYGRQKADAEKLILSLGNNGAVVRLTKVFQPGMPLLNRWKVTLAEGGRVEAFEDYFCSPVALSDVVVGMESIINKRGFGIWQFSPPDQISYADIASEVARGLGVPQERIQRVSARGRLKHLPRFTSLDASRASQQLQLVFDVSSAVIQKVCLS